MALSTELLKRLNTDDEPLAKRLKLAENVFHTVDLPILRKEDLILQWLSKVSVMEDPDIWSSLKRCLQAKDVNIKRDVKKLLVDSFVHKFQQNTKNVHGDIFECCKLLVTSTGVQQYFISQPKELGRLIEALLNFTSKLLKGTFKVEEQATDKANVAELITLVQNTIISVVESIIQMFKSSFAMKDSFRKMFIKDILYSLCSIIDRKCTDNTNRLGAVTHKCIQHVIFIEKHVKAKSLSEDQTNAVFADLLSMMAKNIGTKNLECNILTYDVVFHAAVGFYKTNSNILDLIFRELADSAGTYKRPILCCFLKRMSDVTLDFDNKVNDITLFDYCQNIVDSILSSNNIINTDYELLVELANINPIIIEKKIPDILRKVFSEVSRVEYTNVMVAILNVSIRLRREEKLISQVLIAVKHFSNKVSNSDIQINKFLPQEFKDKFTKSVNNITNLQGVTMLKTLIYHLNIDCMEVLQCEYNLSTNFLIVKTTVELLAALLDGVCMFEYTGTLNSHRKFTAALDELGNVLSLLVTKALQLTHNENIIVVLLNAVSIWSETQNALKYYVPKAVTQEPKFPVSQDQWLQLIQRITNFGDGNCKDSMNELTLHRLKIAQTMSNDSSVKLSGLIGDLFYIWRYILKSNPEIITLLTNKELAKIVCWLLEDMVSSEESFNQWVTILKKDYLQENRNFVVCLLYCTLMKIGDLATQGMTKSITEHISSNSSCGTDKSKIKKTIKTLTAMKEDLAKNDWIQMEHSVSCEVERNLKILLHLPLMYLNTDVRLIIFMVVYAIRKECGQKEEVLSLTNTIFLDLLEKPGLDMFQYINPLWLIDQLPESRAFQKAVEHSLRKGSSYEALKSFIKSCKQSKETLSLLLQAMENARYKLSAEQRIIFRKAGVKLSKIILKKKLPTELKEAIDVKTLILILKISIAKKSFDKNLINLAQSTLSRIFTLDTDTNHDTNNEMLVEGSRLAIIILRDKNTFTVPTEVIKGIWSAMFQYPSTDLLLCLLESSNPKEFKEVLDLLHTQMVNYLSERKKNALDNVIVIWNAILKTDMSAERKKTRLSMINTLVQTVHIGPLSDDCWVKVLQLIQSILAAKHLLLPGNIIDMSILIGLKSIEVIGILACNDALTLCGILLKVRTSLITDRLPALLLLYRSILTAVANSTSKTEKPEEYAIRCIAIDIEKFTSSLIKLKKDMVRISPYLVADLLELFLVPSIAPYVKASIQNCVGQLISICDHHGIALLSRSLPVSMQEIFKIQLDTFNKFYKFSGKI